MTTEQQLPFMDAKEVATVCNVGIAKGYEIIRNLNAELQKKGMYTLQGKVNRRFFQEKMYL